MAQTRYGALNGRGPICRRTPPGANLAAADDGEDFVTEPDSDERDVIGDLEEIILDCGFVHFEIPTEGPGSTYIVMIVPSLERVFRADDEDDTPLGQRLGYRGEGLDGSTSVRIYAIPDTEVSAERRQVLGRANGADLSHYDADYPDDPDAVHDPDAVEAALTVESWVTEGNWKNRLALNYVNDPLLYGGLGPPDRPTDLVTIMLPASLYDEFAERY
jgi:hypothetical protein